MGIIIRLNLKMKCICKLKLENFIIFDIKSIYSIIIIISFFITDKSICKII